jgi:hypothetical protein
MRASRWLGVALMSCAAAVAQEGRDSAAASCAADAPLPEFTLDYEVHAVRAPLRLAGTNRMQYTWQGNQYTLVSELEAGGFFNARQQSSGTIEAGAWRPQRYEETSPRRGTSVTTIDWRARRVTFSTDVPSQPAPAGLQDRLSALLQIGRVLARSGVPERLELAIAGPRHVSRYRIEVQGHETVDVPRGRFDTVRLLRVRDDSDDRLELWLAPALCWLPVQLRFAEPRQTIEHRLSSVRFAPPAPAGGARR